MSKMKYTLIALLLIVGCDQRDVNRGYRHPVQPQTEVVESTVQRDVNRGYRPPVQHHPEVVEPTDPAQLLALKRKELAKLQKELADIKQIRVMNKIARKQNPWIDEIYEDLPQHPLEIQNDVFEMEEVEIQGKIAVIMAEIYGLQQLIVSQSQTETVK